MSLLRSGPLLLGSAVAAAVLMAASLAIAEPVASSCAWLSGQHEAAIQTAEIAFVGTVTGVRSGDRIATLDVEEIWKGPNLSDPIEVYGGSDDSNQITSVDRTWEVGLRYLVVPAVDKAGRLRDDACSPTSVYKAEFDALRPPNAHPPQGPPTSGPPGATPIAAVFLAILVFGSVGVFFLFRTGRAAPGRG
jgi:hypothetical protein